MGIPTKNDLISFLSVLTVAVLIGGTERSVRAQAGTSGNRADSGVLLTEVTIVNTHNGALTSNQSVCLEGGKITRIGSAAIMRRLGRERSVDAHGKFLVPGYWDMHAHVFDPEQTRDNLALMLANDITGFRQMADTDEQR